MTNDEPTTKRPRLDRQARIALIGLGAAIVLAAGAFAGWSIVAGSPQAGGTPTAADKLVTASPTPTPIPREIDLNHAFKSQSGNLRCSVGTFSGQPGAICQQVNINYVVPAGACPSEGTGVFVGVGRDGAYWPCVSVWREPEEVVAYDTPVTQAGVTCSISYETGVTCTNAEGKGFTMEYDAGITTF